MLLGISIDNINVRIDDVRFVINAQHLEKELLNKNII